VSGEISVTRNKYATFLIRFQPGAAKDLPLVSPYAHALALKRTHSHDGTDALLQAYKTDPFLAAKICGVANSIFFNLHHIPVLTINDALERVGLDYARKLLLDAQSAQAARAPQDYMGYWAHCMTVSHAAAEIAKLAPALNVSAEAGALMGLIHDIGYLVKLNYNPEFLSEVLATIRGLEADAARDSHTELGESLCSFWSLPIEIRDALKGHHDLSRCSTKRGRELAALLQLANRIALGAPLEDAPAQRSLALLKLSENALLPAFTAASLVHTQLMITSLVA
jgi:putative nucleotidyltransferase with HDIG domain